jgi:hypothetical protein
LKANAQIELKEGSDVIAKCGSSFFYAVISQVLPEQEGCMVTFEEDE